MTTKDEVSAMFKSREADAKDLVRRLNGDDNDEAVEEFDELPLEVRTERHVVIVLSTGGPHEEIDATLYDDGTVKSATFGAYWGSDKAITQLRDEDALWRLAERYAEYVSEQ